MAACRDFQTSQERKIKMLFDNMKYMNEEGEKKKVNAAYIRLMRYSTNIDIYRERYNNIFRKAS